MARKKSTAAAADPTVEPTTPAADLVQTGEPTTVEEPTAPAAADLPTVEPTKKQMTAEEKRAAQLATLARARAIWSESCKAGTSPRACGLAHPAE